LRVKDVKFDDIGGVIVVNGKTGPRRVKAVWSVSYLKDWIEDHPGKDNLEAPLWFNYAKKGKVLKPMRYEAIRMRLIKSLRKQELTKKFIPICSGIQDALTWLITLLNLR
jgi:hypothetical protein